MHIETARLILRRPTLADVPALFAFLGDAEAMRHTHADATPRDCRRRIAAYERRRRRDGYAPWTAVQKKEDGRIVGWGGLYEDPFETGWGVEVGYWFHPSAWGRGYAGELVAACTELADGALALAEVSAFAHPGNAASRRVLERAGFEAQRWVPEMERLLFRRVRPGSGSD